MQEFQEGNLKFSFPKDWNTIAYEKSNHYISSMMPLQNTKAVDFLCCNKEKLTLVEVKHFLEKPINDLTCLIDEVSCQFKDTICGITMGHLNSISEMKLYADALLPHQPSEHHTLVLFLEIEKETPKHTKINVHRLALQYLRNKFIPLGFAVRVLDSSKLSKHPWKAEVQ